jgi:hypothetical protein
VTGWKAREAGRRKGRWPRLEAQEILQWIVRTDAADRGAAQQEEPGGLEERLCKVSQAACDVERNVVLTERSTGEISPAAADEVLSEIEVRAARTGP